MSRQKTCLTDETAYGFGHDQFQADESAHFIISLVEQKQAQQSRHASVSVAERMNAEKIQHISRNQQQGFSLFAFPKFPKRSCNDSIASSVKCGATGVNRTNFVPSARSSAISFDDDFHCPSFSVLNLNKSRCSC
jgi:hypothetical protein